jgi:Cys-tRNA synthase (O-phospho-L-seryl-tRNA:Cys-tRNA synthase)
MKEIGTKDYCKEVLKQSEKAVKKEISLIGCNPIMDKLMDGLRDWNQSS